MNIDDRIDGIILSASQPYFVTVSRQLLACIRADGTAEFLCYRPEHSAESCARYVGRYDREWASYPQWLVELIVIMVPTWTGTYGALVSGALSLGPEWGAK